MPHDESEGAWQKREQAAYAERKIATYRVSISHGNPIKVVLLSCFVLHLVLNTAACAHALLAHALLAHALLEAHQKLIIRSLDHYIIRSLDHLLIRSSLLEAC